MTIPDFLPSLAAGAHDAGAGEACVMEYVSLLAGEEWSDRPECTHALLAHEARMLNDDLGDRDRHLLVPLVGRLFGTTEDSPELTVRLRLRQVAAVVRLLEPGARPRVAAVVGRAEAVLAGGGASDEAPEEASDEALEGASVGPSEEALDALVVEARAVARAFFTADSGDEGAHHHNHHRLARMAFVALAGQVDAAEAWALAALVAAHQVAALGECRADCGDTESHARLRVRELTDLLDEYDAVTGRATRRLTGAEFRELADLVG